MQKLTFTFCLLLFISFSSSAQKAEDNPLSLFERTEADMHQNMVGTARNFFTLSLGLALPESEFGSSYVQHRAGFAGTGPLINAHLGIMLTRNIGIISGLSTYINPVKKDDYLQRVLERLPNGASGNIKNAMWFSSVVGAGPCLVLPENKITVELKFQAGLLLSRSPKMSFIGEVEGESIVDFRRADMGLGFGVIAGAGIGFPIGLGYDLKGFVSADYIGGSIKIDMTETVNSTTYNSTSNSSFRQNVGIFSISVGIKYEFGYAQEKMKHGPFFKP